MKAIVKPLVFSLACFTFQFGLWSAEPNESIDRALAEKDLTFLIQTARTTWAYAEDKQEHFEVNLDNLLREGKTALTRCQTKRDVLELFEETVAQFKDGHASLSHPDLHQKGIYAKLPYPLIDTKDGVVFGKNLVVLWNGQSMEEAIRSASKRTYASTSGMRRRLALRELEWSPSNTPLRLTLKQPDGQVVETNIIYNADSARTPYLQYKWLTNQIAYLKLSSFRVDTSGSADGDPEAKNASGLPMVSLEASKAKISAAFAQANGARCLILDLRGNMGGTDTLGSLAALHLLPGAFTYFKLQTRNSAQLRTLPGFEKNPTKEWIEPTTWGPDRPSTIQAFPGFVIVLQDQLCFSTTDNFLACLRDWMPADRVRFIGRPSGAGTGAPRAVATLPWSGAKLTLTIMKVFSPKGRLIEGRGTIPDRLIEWSWKDILEERDADMAAALEEAQKLIQN